RSWEEKKECREDLREMEAFNEFIKQSKLIDALMVGKSFMWFGLGNRFRQLDRFLISDVG
ncbi:hypothetical protein J1N35_041508, partial [Gossypium stocksii]